MFFLVLACGFVLPWADPASIARAEHEGVVQILLLGDSTTEGSVPRRLKPEGPHLERVLEQLLAAVGDLPACHVINSSLSGETIRRLLDSGRYARDAEKLPGLDYIFIRYGLNDRAKLADFPVDFPQDFHKLLARLRADHPQALLIPMTVIPFANESASSEINAIVRDVARIEKLEVFDIYPRYAAELTRGQNMLNYRRYSLSKIPEQYHELVKPFVHGPSVEVMANELDGILGHLPNWYGDRHPNLAGYNVIADETAKYLAPLLRKKKTGPSGDVQLDAVGNNSATQTSESNANCQEAATSPTNSKQQSLFNGKDLTGWHVDVPQLDKNPDAKATFVVRDNLLVSLGAPAGHLITDAKFENYRLEVEYRFAAKPGNCGVLVHASTPRALYKMFPQSIEVQMNHEHAGDFWCIVEDITVPDMVKRRGPKEKWGITEGKARRILNLTDGSEKPVGEWNSMVIECHKDQIKVWVNGDLVNHGTKCTATRGQIALQAEGSEVEFRKLVLQPISKLTDS